MTCWICSQYRLLTCLRCDCFLKKNYLFFFFPSLLREDESALPSASGRVVMSLSRRPAHPKTSLFTRVAVGRWNNRADAFSQLERLVCGLCRTITCESEQTFDLAFRLWLWMGLELSRFGVVGKTADFSHAHTHIWFVARFKTLSEKESEHGLALFFALFFVFLCSLCLF